MNTKKTFLLFLIFGASVSGTRAGIWENPDRDTVIIEERKVIISQEDVFKRPANYRDIRIGEDTLAIEAVEIPESGGSCCNAGWKWGGFMRGHWSGFTVGYSGYMGSLSDFSLPDDARGMSLSNKSIGVQINFFDFSVVRCGRFTLLSGIGMEVNNYRFSQDVTIVNDDGTTVVDYHFIADGVNLSKSKLTTAYLNVPLLAEFAFGLCNRGFVNFGVVGGWRMNGHTKYKVATGAGNGTYKDRDDLNLSNFHGGVTVNVGYNSMAVSASYYPSPMFRKDQGPELHQINVGLGVLF